MVLVGSIRHADVLLVNGSINKKDKPRLQEIYEQAPKPVLVVAIGACGCTGGIFAEGDTFAEMSLDPHLFATLIHRG